MGAVVDIQPRNIAATPGGQAVVTVRVRNSGAVIDQFDLEILGDAQPWAAIDPPTISLFPGAEGTALITFAPPRSPRTTAGPMPFGLRVASKEDPAGSVVTEGTVEVAPFTEVSAEIVPRSSRGSTGATHDIAIDNRGNVALNAVLRAVDADRLLGFDISPPAVLAEPGAAVFSKVRVKPLRTFLRGAAITRPFLVEVAVPDAAPVTLEGSLLQTPILPPATFRVLAIAAVLVIAGIVAWSALVKPAIEATARDQAIDVLAAVGITPPPSGGAPSGGGDASPSPSTSDEPTSDPGASASPEATSNPSTPPGLGGATPTDGRLVAGAPPVKPADGMTLYLTDLVFSNPSDTAIGEIRLERSGQRLLVLRLENFRDLDFHFVTPIVVGADQDVRLVCPDGCPGAALYYSGFQRP